jgi:hypothetical protein
MYWRPVTVGATVFAIIAGTAPGGKSNVPSGVPTTRGSS